MTTESISGAGKVRPSILVISYSNLSIDARVLRQLRWLQKNYAVTSATFGESPVAGVEHIELENLPPYEPGRWTRLKYIFQFVLGRFGRLERSNWRDQAALTALQSREWDIVIANDTSALSLAARVRSRFGFLADLHEYSPRQAEESFIFRLTEARYARWLLHRYLPRASAATTVGEGIAEEYFKEFGVLPLVVANAAPFRTGNPGQVGTPIRVVHSAAPSPARRIEVMIEAFLATTANVTLDLYLINDGSEYVSKLRKLADGSDRVRILPPIPNSRLVETLSGYDLGVHILPPINFNHRWALPNKLFDYVQARLGILVGPSPEMQRIVESHGLGRVAEDFSAQALTAVLDQLDQEMVTGWKYASHHAAQELSGEHQLELLEEHHSRYTRFLKTTLSSTAELPFRVEP